MSKGYMRLPQFPGNAVNENNTSKFRFTVRTPTSENAPHTPGDSEVENFEGMSGANAPLISQNGNFDDEDYLSEGNRQSYGSQGKDKGRRNNKGCCSRCWWFLCCGWKGCCQRHVFLFAVFYSQQLL